MCVFQFVDVVKDTQSEVKFQNLATDSHIHGEDLQVQITFAIKALKSDLDKMESECLTALNKKEDEIINTLTEITQSIDE